MKPQPETLELATVTKETVVARPAPSALDMIQSVIDKGVTSENVAALRELVALKRDMDADQAKREFIRAFTELQRHIPQIKALHPVPDKSGGVKFMVAKFDEIDSQVRPLCLAHGFSYTWGTAAVENGRQTAVFTLMHAGGHCVSTNYSVRIGGGPPGSTEAQADGAAISYAKRGAMCAALSIMIDRDSDPREDGDLKTKVTKDQAEELERRAQLTNSNIPAFLKFAGAPTFAEIPVSRYEALDAMLRTKEVRGR